MLDFTCDTTNSDEDTPFEGLPNDFFHDGDTPTFSPIPIPSPEPILETQALQTECFKKSKKKKKAPKEDIEDSGNVTQSSEDKENYKSCQNKEITYKSTRKNLKVLKDKNDRGYETDDAQVGAIKSAQKSYGRPTSSRSKKKMNNFRLEEEVDENDHEKTVPAKTERKKNQDSKKERCQKYEITYKNPRKNLKVLKEKNDSCYETDQVHPMKPVRRSYERPVYLRKKKVGPFGLEVDEEDEHEETVPAKTEKRKHCGPSKKEEMELEKWAKAFNEQCMQVENYNLCVE